MPEEDSNNDDSEVDMQALKAKRKKLQLKDMFESH